MVNKESKSEELALMMVKAMQDIKADNIKVLDLRKLDYAVTDFFVVCEAESNTKVNAIFESIDKIVKENLGQDPVHIEGRDENIWILLDYIDAVAHIFQPEARKFYKLESLWAEASIKNY